MKDKNSVVSGVFDACITNRISVAFWLCTFSNIFNECYCCYSCCVFTQAV